MLQKEEVADPNDNVSIGSESHIIPSNNINYHSGSSSSESSFMEHRMKVQSQIQIQKELHHKSIKIG